jgi:hypothetical protein
MPLLGTLLAAHASALIHLERFEEARALLEGRLAALPALENNDWQASRLRCLLGSALCGVQQYDQAETLLLEGYEGLRSTEGQIPLNYRFVVREAAASLAKLYESRSRPGDEARAEEFRQIASKASVVP